jgi:hypothetical protein
MPHTSPRRLRRGRRRVDWGAKRWRSTTTMLELDDSELTDEEREFLQRWADALQVPVAVLICRILSAAVDGDQYIQSRPED